MLLRALSALSALATLLPLALADVQFTTPVPGATIAGDSPLQIKWKDSGNSPALSSFSSYQLFLVAGGDDAASQVTIATLVPQGDYAAGNSAQGTVPVSAGGSDKNAYFFKITSVATQGGTVINYSNRFTLTGMTGSFPDNVKQGIAAVGDSTDGPPTENTVNNGGNVKAVAAANEPAAYTTPYTEQTGLTRYAPMQSIPPTKITMSKYTPLFPTSAVTFANAFLPKPTIEVTITESQTFSVQSQENTASPAPQPTVDDMQKFLRRWKD